MLRILDVAVGFWLWLSDSGCGCRILDVAVGFWMWPRILDVAVGFRMWLSDLAGYSLAVRNLRPRLLGGALRSDQCPRMGAGVRRGEDGAERAVWDERCGRYGGLHGSRSQRGAPDPARRMARGELCGREWPGADAWCGSDRASSACAHLCGVYRGALQNKKTKKGNVFITSDGSCTSPQCSVRPRPAARADASAGAQVAKVPSVGLPERSNPTCAPIASDRMGSGRMGADRDGSGRVGTNPDRSGWVGTDRDRS